MSQLQVGSSAPDFTLLNAANETVTLSSLWQKQPVLLTFLRHFG
jgi:peroxiredoxin